MAFLVTPLYVADKTNEVDVETPEVVMPKVAEKEPCGTTTCDEAGLAAAGLEVESATGIPPAGAGAESVTVPVAVVPLTIDVVLRVRLERAGAVTTTGGSKVIVELSAPPFTDAVTLARVFVVVAEAVAGTAALWAPAGTIRVAGTARAVWLLLNETVVPEAGAAEVRVTLQVADPGVCRVVGEQAIPERLGEGATDPPYWYAPLSQLPLAGLATGVRVEPRLVSEQRAEPIDAQELVTFSPAPRVEAEDETGAYPSFAV